MHFFMVLLLYASNKAELQDNSYAYLCHCSSTPAIFSSSKHLCSADIINSFQKTLAQS